MVEEQRHPTRQLSALRFDAGSLSLNLVATVARRFAAPLERLASVDRLRAWLAGSGLEMTAALEEEDLGRVRRLREHLDELFRSAVAGAQPPAAALAEVNAAVASYPPQLSAAQDGPVLTRPGSTAGALDPVLALIAADAIRILVSGDRGNLRTCAAADCRMLYLAHGRRQRRWCSSQRCGNRSRVAAHRARAATSPTSKEG
jgi:predicted RNA-binding Zn ribbon-like protein